MYEMIRKDQPVIQKYGGTSVGTTARIRNIAKRVAAQQREGWEKLAVVVSAQSGETNRLVGLVREINDAASGIAYDMAIAAGEQVSVGLMTAALEAEGAKAMPLLAYQLGILTDDAHAKARIKTIATEKLEAAWASGCIPVIAGFQGVTKDGSLTTLGRGGSDTSAVALACAVNAGFCEINTDVDGVFTADPRYVKSARLIPKLDFEVALEMASLGSKVLHPRCVELGAKHGMPIVVRDSFKPNDSPRTVIMPLTNQKEIEDLVVSGITLDRDVAKINVGGLPDDSKAIAKVFALMAERNINVDIIVHNRVESAKETTRRIGFTIAGAEAPNALSALQSLKREYAAMTTEKETGFAKVSAVGVGMRSYAGVAGRAFTALTSADIDIHMISTSEIKISCVVPEAQAENAANALHKAFIDEA